MLKSKRFPKVQRIDAYVMYYVYHSMKHFIERVKGRPETAVYFFYEYNKIDLEDNKFLRLLPKVNKMAVKINDHLLKSALTLIK